MPTVSGGHFALSVYIFINSLMTCTCGSGFQIWYDNVPHPKLVEYKKEQNWVVKSGDYLVFPGGGTQFKEGVNHYIEFIEKVCQEVASQNLSKL